MFFIFMTTINTNNKHVFENDILLYDDKTLAFQYVSLSCTLHSPFLQLVSNVKSIYIPHYFSAQQSFNAHEHMLQSTAIKLHSNSSMCKVVQW